MNDSAPLVFSNLPIPQRTERTRRTGKTVFVCVLCAVFPSSNSGEVCHARRICSPMLQSRSAQNLSTNRRELGNIHSTAIEPWIFQASLLRRRIRVQALPSTAPRSIAGSGGFCCLAFVMVKIAFRRRVRNRRDDPMWELNAFLEKLSKTL